MLVLRVSVRLALAVAGIHRLAVQEQDLLAVQAVQGLPPLSIRHHAQWVAGVAVVR
jgi:hypothetical protein